MTEHDPMNDDTQVFPPDGQNDVPSTPSGRPPKKAATKKTPDDEMPQKTHEKNTPEKTPGQRSLAKQSPETPAREKKSPGTKASETSAPARKAPAKQSAAKQSAAKAVAATAPATPPAKTTPAKTAPSKAAPSRKAAAQKPAEPTSREPATGKPAPGEVSSSPPSPAHTEPSAAVEVTDPLRSGVPETDVYLFAEGTHRYLHRQLGAQPGEGGTRFAVWAPNARRVDVAGSFDAWAGEHHLVPSSSGIWTAWVDGAGIGDSYVYRIVTADGRVVEKSDPVGAATEEPPSICSVIADLRYDWGDGDWMATRGDRFALDAPVSIYEVHLGSWGRHVSSGRRFPRYDELADPLADHALAHGFTHVELMPIMEHPFYGSWGYQTTGFFAPSARYGTPVDLMRMIDRMHQRGVGVILDWVPSHFPTDTHGLYEFDGTHLFEHADPRQGYHPDWHSAIFNYERNETRSFLTSSAMCWLDRYHVDGLRVDAVASMLYLDYSRNEGEWIPNQYGGRENLGSIQFLRQLNEAVYEEFPQTGTVAEESTAWPMVSRPTYVGGLGFGYKWDMGWMHDTLQYLQRDSVHRKWHHGEITFRSVYSSSENYVLPLSHDEVVHGKGSLLNKMSGDEWQQFANLRLLYAMQWAQPGKKLLFMGCELATRSEWNHDSTLDWSLHDADLHGGVRTLVGDLNRLYASEPAMHRGDCDGRGIRWVEGGDAAQSVYAWLRLDPREKEPARPVLVLVNATPTPRHNYRVGVPTPGRWQELLNTDAEVYGGSGTGNFGGVATVPVDAHGFHQSLVVSVPPLGAVFLALES